MREEPIQLARGVRIPAGALRWTYARSGGPGGQNVNKRATKAVLRVPIGVLGLTEAAAERLRSLGSHYVTADDELVIACDESRERPRNRRACLARLAALVAGALPPPKPRYRTRPTRGSIERRITQKKQRGQTKRSRRERFD